MNQPRRQPPHPAYTIDPTRDHLIALAALPEWHEVKTGRKLHRSVPYQWQRRGVRAGDEWIRLPTTRIGGVRYTSEEALAWWAAALEAAKDHPSGRTSGDGSDPT